MLGVRDGYQNDYAACTAVRAVRSPIVDGRTQWMVLSATINNPEVASCLGGKGGCHVLRGLWSLRYNAGILSKNGGHHAIPHRKQPLEMIFSNFFQKSIFPLQ